MLRDGPVGLWVVSVTGVRHAPVLVWPLMVALLLVTGWSGLEAYSYVVFRMAAGWQVRGGVRPGKEKWGVGESDVKRI